MSRKTSRRKKATFLPKPKVELPDEMWLRKNAKTTVIYGKSREEVKTTAIALEALRYYWAAFRACSPWMAESTISLHIVPGYVGPDSFLVPVEEMAMAPVGGTKAVVVNDAGMRSIRVVIAAEADPVTALEYVVAVLCTEFFGNRDELIRWGCGLEDIAIDDTAEALLRVKWIDDTFMALQKSDAIVEYTGEATDDMGAALEKILDLRECAYIS